MIFIMTNFCFKKKYSRCTLPEGCHPLDPNHWCLGVQLWSLQLFSHATECKRKKKGLQLKSWAPWCYFKLNIGPGVRDFIQQLCHCGMWLWKIIFISLGFRYPLGLQILASTLSQKSLEIPIFFLFYFIFKLYIIVLVLPNIKMNPSQVYLKTISKRKIGLQPGSRPVLISNFLAEI